MPIDTVVDPKTGWRIHTVTGELGLDEARNALAAIYDDPQYDPDSHALWDLRDAVLSGFSADQIRSLASYVGERWGASGRNRAALVVSRDLDFGLARMYEQLLTGRTTSEVRVFRVYSEAIDWLSQ
jgi:hypothetical protein